jgi:predicted NAD-dependent protein-ADP-ribosyltransferase YbiA (DUF1768 family)
MTKLLTIIHELDNYRAYEETDPDAKALKRIRKWRDAELAACDWTQVADAVCDKAAWAKYRKDLRDLPASNADVKLIELPVKPSN